VAFAPDRRTLATAGGTVILWDLSNPAQPRPLGQPLGGDSIDVRSVAFSPDGGTLATVGGNKVVLWDLTELQDLRDHAIARACTITKSGLDRDDWARFVTGLPFQSTCPR
jgi:WD40 repeat protein